MHIQKEKDPLVLADLASRKKISINPSIAQKRLSDIIFDADACAINPDFAELRGFLKVSDFVC